MRLLFLMIGFSSLLACKAGSGATNTNLSNTKQQTDSPSTHAGTTAKPQSRPKEQCDAIRQKWEGKRGQLQTPNLPREQYDALMVEIKDLETKLKDCP
jgi:flagellar motility protein MotE (MotC chaperone)